MQQIDAEELLRRQGIMSPETGLSEAEARFKQTLRDLLPAMAGENGMSAESMGMMGLLTRAQAFHEAAIWAIREGNPFAAYTLIRGYAENAALLVYLREKPSEIRRISPLAAKSDRIKIGRLVAFANKRYGGFATLYDRLSSYAHPESSALLAGFQVGGEDGRFEWRTAPQWKDPIEGPRWACLWLIEITNMHKTTWAPTMQHVQAWLQAHPEDNLLLKTAPETEQKEPD